VGDTGGMPIRPQLPPKSGRHTSGPRVLVVLVVAVVAVVSACLGPVGMGPVGMAPAAAQSETVVGDPGPPTTAAQRSAAEGSVAEGSVAEASVAEGSAPPTTVRAVGGPQPSGRPEPAMAQRVADSLIWVWLLAALILGPAAWVWTGRSRRDRPAPPPAGDPPAAGDPAARPTP
jgi:hypothetical protein